MIRGSVVLTCVLIVVPVVTWARSQSNRTCPCGVVVKEVDATSVAHVAGIRSGDVLLSWSQGPHEYGPICDTFDQADAEQERAPRGAVTLSGLRSGKKFSVSVPPGEWLIESHPQMRSDIAALVAEVHQKAESGNMADAATLTDRAAIVAEQARCASLATWLYMREATARINLRDWDAATALYRKAGLIAERASLPKALAQVKIAEAALAKRLKKPLDAEAAYREAIRIRGGSTDSLFTAVMLNVIANSTKDRGDFDAAQKLYGESLAIRERVAPESLPVSESLDNLGLLATSRGDFVTAEQYHKKALAIQEKIAPGSLAVANALYNLAFVYIQQERLDTAAELLQKLLKIEEERIPGTLKVSNTLTNLALVAGRRGDLASAEDFTKRALAIYEKLEPESLACAMALNNLGIIQSDRGDSQSAEATYRKALELYTKLAPGSGYLADTLGNLGAVEQQRGDFALAESHYREALALYEKAGDPEGGMSDVLSRIGGVAATRGDLDLAEDYYRKALVLDEKRAPDSLSVAGAIAQIAILAAERGDLDTAKREYEKSQAIFNRVAPASIDAAGNLSNLGDIAIERGDLATAEALHRQAWAIRQKVAPGTVDEADSLIHLATIERKKGDLQSADGFAQRALAIVRKNAPNTPFDAEMEHEAGLIARTSGRLTDAAAAFLRAIEALESTRSRLGGSEEGKAGFAARYKQFYWDYIEVLIQLGRPADAFSVLERSRARSLLAMMAERDLVFPSDIPPQLERERMLADREYDRAQAALAHVQPGNEKEFEALREHLRTLRQKQSEIADRIRQSSPRLASLRYPQPLDAAAVRKSLDDGTVMLSYAVGETRTILFAMTAASAGGSDVAVYTIDAGEKSLRSEIDRLRSSIEFQRGDALAVSSLLQQSKALYTQLVKPAEKLVAKSQRVLICPDGPLNVLPFAALAVVGTTSHPKFLIEQKPLHTVVSATVYAEVRKSRDPLPSRSAAVDLVAFGDPKYFAASDAGQTTIKAEVRSAVGRSFDLEPLPATRDEVTAIAALFAPRSTEYLGADATEERAKSIGKGVRYVHFACHGLLNERSPLDSALALAVVDHRSDTSDNGLLQAWEVFENVRIDADLVTLSACDTGLGKDLGGEGLIGLSRAFQYAGAHTVLASLWSIADKSTSELMKRFYAQLKNGVAKDEALRRAQIEMIGGPNRTYRHPFHWAAFQLIGDWH